MPSRPKPRLSPSDDRGGPGSVRIIGGKLRGRKFAYSGDPRTRPMKDRVREAIFNLLGPSIVGKQALDLFAGTGALGLEAVSRGAVGATLIERHFPTAESIRRNAAALGIAERCEVAAGDTFHWVRYRLPALAAPAVAFVSPPYDFYVERLDDMLGLVDTLLARLPPGSTLVVEADERLDFGRLPQADRWDVRSYPPAVVGILDPPAV